jgi:hypothetical protein
MSSAGGCPSWQEMASVGTSIVPPGHRPPPEGTPDTSPTFMTSQATASCHDFAVSLWAGQWPIDWLGLSPLCAGDELRLPQERPRAFSIVTIAIAFRRAYATIRRLVGMVARRPRVRSGGATVSDAWSLASGELAGRARIGLLKRAGTVTDVHDPLAGGAGPAQA